MFSKQFALSTCLYLTLPSLVLAQNIAQDNFWVERQWTNAFAVSTVNTGFGLDVDKDGKVYVADGSRIVVYQTNGVVLLAWNVTAARDVALHPNSNLVFVTSFSSANQVQVYTTTGTFVRQWGSSGSGPGQFNFPKGITVSTNGTVFVCDTSNHRIQVFDSSGNYLREWGSFGSISGAFDSPRDIALAPDGSVLVADFNNSRIQVFDQNGVFLRQFKPTGTVLFNLCVVGPDGLAFVSPAGAVPAPRLLTPETELHSLPYFGPPLYTDGAGARLQGGAFSADGQRLYLLLDREVRVLRRGYRTMGPKVANAIPLPLIHSIGQRPGTGWVDVEYTVIDADDTNVTVAAVAFVDGRKDLRSAIKMTTFEDMTEYPLPASVPTGVRHRFTWNAEADWQTNYANVKINLLAKDARGLADFHFLTIPSNATYSTTLQINRSPMVQDDFLGLWTWLIAAGNPDITLVTGNVFGVTAPYTGLLLAQTLVSGTTTNTTTTADGRNFLFQLLGVREATTNEVFRAKVATTPGIVSRWDPRNQVGTLPQKLNEYGFDTGLLSTNPAISITNAWWVVPLTPIP